MLADVTDFCRLFLLCHPELDDAHRTRAVGRGPADLSRRGRAQVLQWMEFFKPIELDAVWSGAQPQCQDPARGLAQAKGLEPAVDPRLEDQELGSWQGKVWDDVFASDPETVRDFFGHFGEIRPPQGEALGEAVERFLAWWGEQRPQQVGKTVALVLSGTLVSGLVAALMGMRLSRGVAFNLPPGGIGVLDVFDNGARIATWNPLAFAG